MSQNINLFVNKAFNGEIQCFCGCRCHCFDNKVEEYLSSFPAGYIFGPSDAELIECYLNPKINGGVLPPNLIHEVDLYKYDPEWLAENYPAQGKKKWYFFTPRDRKYKNGNRPNRIAGTGYWKATGAGKAISNDSSVTVGQRKTLGFYRGQPSRGIKTNYIMHEFTLKDRPQVDRAVNQMKLDDWVLCRIIYKNGEPQSQSGEAPAGGTPAASIENQVPDNNNVNAEVSLESGRQLPIIPLVDAASFADPSSSRTIDKRRPNFSEAVFNAHQCEYLQPCPLCFYFNGNDGGNGGFSDVLPLSIAQQSPTGYLMYMLFPSPACPPTRRNCGCCCGCPCCCFNYEVEEYLSSFPVGYIFEPSDAELIERYLNPKITGGALPPNMIHEVDLYKYDPEQLAAKYLAQGANKWYFLTPRDRKYKNGDRPNRIAGAGYWKATCVDKPISNDSNSIVGCKKTLVFYRGKAPKGAKTNWIMHEFKLKDPPQVDRVANEMRLDDWVLCRIYEKNGGPQSQSGELLVEGTPAAFMENEVPDDNVDAQLFPESINQLTIMPSIEGASIADPSSSRTNTCQLDFPAPIFDARLYEYLQASPLNYGFNGNGGGDGGFFNALPALPMTEQSRTGYLGDLLIPPPAACPPPTQLQQQEEEEGQHGLDDHIMDMLMSLFEDEP